MLRTVMSSIIRRRRGLLSAIGVSPVCGIGLRQPQSSQTGDLPDHITPKSRASGLVQSPSKTAIFGKIEYFATPLPDSKSRTWQFFTGDQIICLEETGFFEPY